MVSDKCTVHFTDFQLKRILYEPTSDQVVILSLEAFKLALFFINRVVHVLQISFDIIPDGRAGSGLYFKHERVPILIVVMTIDLGTQEQVLICN